MKIKYLQKVISKCGTNFGVVLGTKLPLGNQPLTAHRVILKMFYYKIKGTSLRTNKGTVYVIYRNGTEVAKSTGVTVNPKYFTTTTGRVSSKDVLYLEKNELIQQKTVEFQRAVRDLESVGQAINKQSIDFALQLAPEVDAELKAEWSDNLEQGWNVVSQHEARIEELNAEIVKLRRLVWGQKFAFEFHLPKQERYERMINDLQQQLAALEANAAEIRDQITHLQEEAGFISSALFVDKLEEYCTMKLLDTSMQKQTKGNYDLIATAVNRFRPRLQLKDMSLQFFQEFQAHLVARGVTNNSIRGMMSRIKGIYKYFADDYNLPTGFFSKFKQVKATKDKNVLFLSPEELAELKALPLTARVHREVRHQFLFAVETGLRFSDYNITAANIIDREFVVTTKKTGTQVNIPATDEALRLFNEVGQTFRLIPESQFNQTLRLICKKMPSMQVTSVKTLQVGSVITPKPYKKWQRMTSHVARKTFVENAIVKEIDLIAIAHWLGHTDTVMLQKHYAHNGQIAKREAHKLLN